MERYAINELIKWKESPHRKPLIIQGARQVGKTWLMKEFGKISYEKTIYINFDTNKSINNIFENEINTDKIIKALEIISNIKIEPDKTLIIFDEIQETPKAITSLKYFQENAPEYHIICAGSLLGIALHNNTSFPVGKVDFLKLYPLSFTEFLDAYNKTNMSNIIKNFDIDMMKIFHKDLIELLKIYYYIGGMPEVISRFIENNNFKEARKLQKDILLAYENDFSKHAQNNIVPKIHHIWHSIPAQLAKENKKFIYGLIKEGARAKEYENAIMWLSDCGLIYTIYNTTKQNIPLKAYIDLKSFKIYILDTGLLGAMVDLDITTLLHSDIFTEFKGSYTEQFALQQLITKHSNIYYYSSEKGTSELDFLVEYENNIIPVEVKANINLKAKSLKVYMDKFKPNTAIRFSLADYKVTENLIDIPLYAIEYYYKAING